MGHRSAAGQTVNETFVTVMVDEHAAIPDGCCMRFKAVGGARVVKRVRLDDDPSSGAWEVEAATLSGDAAPAIGVLVEDSSAGLSMLVYGAEHGLRLRPTSGGSVVAEPYLLLAERAVVE
jgi:hypothetical protein